ncbi:MAG: ABC transporter permease [Bacteroidetes bacterium]|nr:ABC transporter permease [Bacteroidota bacterium]
MLKNYITIALRNITRHKSFSLINIVGLSLGLVTFLAISLYVADEFSFDQFHEKKDRIYRAVIKADFDGRSRQWGAVPNKLAPAAASKIPEVERAVRVFHHNFGDLAFVSTETEKYAEKELYYADPEIFDVFTLPLVEGDMQKALTRKKTAILNESIAKKYFKGQSPIGKTITVDNTLDLEITGVFKDLPANSSLSCQIIASFSSIRFGQPENQNWGNASFETYLLLKEHTSVVLTSQKISEMLERDIPKEDHWFSVSLQALPDVHLHSGQMDAGIDHKKYGDFNEIKILVGLALAVLVIAAVNYMNLTTAQSQRRNKEVGISKTLGATFAQLNVKFFVEASLLVLIAMLFCLVVFNLLLPSFNLISGKNFTISYLYNRFFIFSFFAIWFFLTLLAGSYPAFYLSSFSPQSVMQKTAGSQSQNRVRKGLVVFQFSISIVLIICMFLFTQQMKFIGNKKLGFKPEQVIAVMTTAGKNPQSIATLKKEFELLPEVKAVSESRAYPGIGSSGYTLTSENDKKSNGTFIVNTRASHEIVEVLGLKLLAGHTLPEQKEAKDTTIQVILNKSAVDYLQWSPEEAIGRRVNIFNGMPTEVVGVVDDFHFASMHQKIGPYCFSNCPWDRMQYLLIRTETSDIRSAVASLEATYKKIIPSAFEYSFLDQQLAGLYEADQRITKVVMIFSGLAVFIACLGLYSLTTYTAEQKIKEIGIRKVMGASVMQLMNMLSKDFLLLVLIAFAISVPVSYFFINRWLEGFAYRTEIGISVFALAGVASLLIAWLTVSVQSFKAANANPVMSLKSE